MFRTIERSNPARAEGLLYFSNRYYTDYTDFYPRISVKSVSSAFNSTHISARLNVTNPLIGLIYTDFFVIICCNCVISVQFLKAHTFRLCSM